jgi:flavin reductase (DIM6/NTAB) family NADH-FMN oxidoreductase RutF
MQLQAAQLTPAQIQNYLQYAIAPRPICFAATVNKLGQVNLSPFSFFNLFSSNPPIVIFSPARRVRNNSTKHTLQNVLEVPEVVINIVDYAMVQQQSLASCEYPQGTNEFEKAGFTMQKATTIQPPMVAEAKIKLECTVTEVKPLGTEGGAGNLVIAQVQVIHIDDAILDSNQQIDPLKLNHVARLGGDWYCKVTPENLFKVPKPNTQLGMGIDALPQQIKHSKVLTGNHLAMLANVTSQPQRTIAFTDDRIKNIVQYFNLNPDDMEREFFIYAAELLNAGNVDYAWQVLLAADL